MLPIAESDRAARDLRLGVLVTAIVIHAHCVAPVAAIAGAGG